MSVTSARADSMDLSEPYMKNELIVVVSGDSTALGLRDLKGKKIGAQSGSTAEEVLALSEICPEIENGKGSQFDPAFADIMIRMIDEHWVDERLPRPAEKG